MFLSLNSILISPDLVSLDVCCLSIEHSGPPGSDLRACEGFCSEVSVQAQRCFAESEPGSDVFSSEVDVVVMLAVPGSLPSLSVWRMPTILADVSKSSRPRGLGTVVGSLLGGLLGSLLLCREGCRRFWADVLKSSKPRCFEDAALFLLVVTSRTLRNGTKISPI